MKLFDFLLIIMYSALFISAIYFVPWVMFSVINAAMIISLCFFLISVSKKRLRYVVFVAFLSLSLISAVVHLIYELDYFSVKQNIITLVFICFFIMIFILRRIGNKE